MQIFVHTSEGLSLEEVDESITVNELAVRFGPAGGAAWTEDADEPLDDTARVSDAVGDKGHVHVNRCRRVTVTVNFAGRSKSELFPPGVTVGRVRRWAIGKEGFDLPKSEAPKHEVGVCGSGVIADRNDHIGTLARDCELCLDLAPKDRFQG